MKENYDKKSYDQKRWEGYKKNCKQLKCGNICLLLRIALILLAGWLLFSRVLLVVQAPDNDMFPAIRGGDLLIGFRLQKNCAKNDVVVYEENGEIHTGRVLGRATDVIMLDDSGTLLVNGTDQSGDILYPTYAKEGISYPCTVPDGCLFILGDYRTQAEDSRDFGCIPQDNLKARVITILRRRTI